MANLITIDQLLESLDLDFEPRWVTKSRSGYVEIWSNKPKAGATTWYYISEDTIYQSICKIKLAEFDGKDWTECIYEVPRKTTGDIKKIEIMPCGEYTTVLSLFDIALKVNEIIDKIEILEERTEDVCARIIEVERAVNELKGAKNE